MLYWFSGGKLHGVELSSGNRQFETPFPHGEAEALVSASMPRRSAGSGTPAATRLLVSLGPEGVAMVAPLPGRTGTAVRWRSGDAGSVTGPVLALPDERLAVFGDLDGDLRAVDIETGRRRWRWRLSEGMHHPPLAHGGKLFTATRANSLYCYDAGGGGERWRAALPGRPAAPPLRIAGTLMVVTRDGKLVEFHPETGAQIGRMRDLGAEVVGVVRRTGDGAREEGWRDRRLFLGLRDGRLAVLGPRS